MKRVFLIIGFLVGFLGLSNEGYGQLSLSYQYSSLNKIGLGYNFSPKLWTELRVFSNTYLEDITPELVLLYNVSQKERHEIYVGVGVVANVFYGLVVPIGLQFRPIENFQQFSIQIEFAPIIDDGIILQSSAGIRYTFSRSK
jgi:hypothetical protein